MLEDEDTLEKGATGLLKKIKINIKFFFSLSLF